MFVGRDRQAAVERLMLAWDEVKTQTPLMVFLNAPMGWGKTRIIQEFYARLAATEGLGYWPPTIASEAQNQDVSILTTERKRLNPERFVARGNPPYIWLGISADPSDFARPEEAYRSLVEQLEPHLQPILRRKRLPKSVALTVWKTLTAFVPIPADVSTYLDVHGAVKDFVEEWRSGHGVDRVIGPDTRAEEQAANFWRLLNSVWGEDGRDGPPIVLAIEDAHFISETSVELIRALLTSRLPILIVAAGWPQSERTDERLRPFAGLVASHLNSVRAETLEELGPPEMASLIRTWHPGTPENLVSLLVRRTLGNPYALRLALIRLEAKRGDPVIADLEKVEQMPLDIHDQFAGLLWTMSESARRGLAAVALVGYRLPAAIAERAARAVENADLSAAISSDWIRADRASAALLTFIEPIRHEVARDRAVRLFTAVERRTILEQALAEVKRLLGDGVPDPDRGLLYELHLGLGEEGVEPDLDAVLRSSAALLDELRSRRAKATIREVVARADLLVPVGDSDAARAEYEVARSRALRYANTRADPATGSAVASALKAATKVRAERPDLYVRAHLEKARLHRSIDVRAEYDMTASRVALDEAMRVVEAEHLADIELLHDARQCEYGVVSAEQDRRRACDLALIASHSARAMDGTHTLQSIEALADAAWYAARTEDIDLAVELTRQVVELRVQFWGSDSHPRVAATMKDLAVRIVRQDRDEAMGGAYDLCDTAFEALDAAYGPEDSTTLNALSARGYASLRYALVLRSRGQEQDARALLAGGLADASRVLAVRTRLWPRSDFLLAHERLTFAKALNGDVSAIDDLLLMLEKRRVERRQGPTYAEVRWLVADIARAMEFHGQRERARTLRSEYPASRE